MENIVSEYTIPDIKLDGDNTMTDIAEGGVNLMTDRPVRESTRISIPDLVRGDTSVPDIERGDTLVIDSDPEQQGEEGSFSDEDKMDSDLPTVPKV